MNICICICICATGTEETQPKGRNHIYHTPKIFVFVHYGLTSVKSPGNLIMGHKFGSEMSTLSNTYQIPICSSSRQFETVAIEVAACIPAQFLSHSQIQLFSIPTFFNSNLFQFNLIVCFTQRMCSRSSPQSHQHHSLESNR